MFVIPEHKSKPPVKKVAHNTPGLNKVGLNSAAMTGGLNSTAVSDIAKRLASRRLGKKKIADSEN